MWVNSMLMTRDNPSIATKVNTMTSSVIILLLGNAQLRCLCHRSVRQEKIIDSGVAELMQRAYLSCLYRGLFSIPLFLKSSVSARSFPNSSPMITKSRVQKPVLFRMFFRWLSSFWGRPRETSEGWVVLQCRIAIWYASKTFPIEFSC